MRAGNVAVLPTPRAIDEAWEHYAELQRRALEDRTVLLDREHMQARSLAYEDFNDLFLRSVGRR